MPDRNSAATHLALIPLVLFAVFTSGCGSEPPAPAVAVPPSPQNSGSELPTEAEGNAALTRFGAKHRPVYCGGRAKPWVALTFDDGPGPYTKKMLKILRKAQLPASFFVTGRNVTPFKSSLLATQRQDIPIGNHSWSHPLLTTLSVEEQRSQLSDTNVAVKRSTGKPVRFFRPPYGAHDRATDRIARNLDMPIILWNIDSEDALGANSKKISKLVKKGFKPGSIILMHENRGQTLRAMKYTIVPALKKSGMTAVTAPQMLAGNPPTANQLAKGRKGCG